jgi:hypothetical protein
VVQGSIRGRGLLSQLLRSALHGGASTEVKFAPTLCKKVLWYFSQASASEVDLSTSRRALQGLRCSRTVRVSLFPAFRRRWAFVLFCDRWLVGALVRVAVGSYIAAMFRAITISVRAAVFPALAFLFLHRVAS